MSNCRLCAQAFEITGKDRAFYATMDVTEPTLCPACRVRRRMSWRNERMLHRRKCDFTGKQVLSIYSQSSPHKVYAHHEWLSDKWDPLSYGRDFDFKRPFLEQFDELHKAVPLPSLNMQHGNENCEYANLVTRNKDCYLIFAANDNRDCYYCNYMHRSTDVVDSFFVFDCERCYECVDCSKCVSVTYSEYCENCSDSAFLRNCRNCKHCFGCVSLVNKEYHMFNQPVPPAEYEKRVAEVFANADFLTKAREMLLKLAGEMPQKYCAGVQNENVTGDHLLRCRNAEECFDCTDLEDCKYCTWLHQAKNCMDCYAWGLTGELGYESHLCGNTFYNMRFCDSCWNTVSNMTYCRYCMNSKDLFGCIGLRNKQYCIFNKQYTKEEYEKLVPKIIAHMKKGKEWGEFFPSAMSPFSYADTMAQDYFPLTKETAKKQGMVWRDEQTQTAGKETVAWKDLPHAIAQVPENITEEILACTGCRRNFRIIPQELKFYRTMNLSLPKSCFECRQAARRVRRNPRQLWDRACMKCKKDIRTSYAPDRPELVYCESCYLSSVY